MAYFARKPNHLGLKNRKTVAATNKKTVVRPLYALRWNHHINLNIFRSTQFNMAVWQVLIAHPDFNRLRPMYDDLLPIEVRSVCARWIEERTQAEEYIDINHPLIEHYAGYFHYALQEQLAYQIEKINTAELLPLKSRLKIAAETFARNSYQPLETYQKIRTTILIELEFLRKYNELAQQVDTEKTTINQQIEQTVQLCADNKHKFNCYKDKLERYDNEWPANWPSHSEFYRVINITGLTLHYTITRAIVDMTNIHKLIVSNRLDKWQRDRSLMPPMPKSALTDIEIWFETLAELLRSTRHLLQSFRSINLMYDVDLGDVVDTAHTDVTNLLRHLIGSAFIVVKQPSQIMTSGAR